MLNYKNRYQMIKSFYEEGLWSKEYVKKAVRNDWISFKDYKEITGEEYIETDEDFLV